MSEAQQCALRSDHCQNFVDIFDVERNGVLTKHEFVNFARFILIIAYLDTADGKLLTLQADIEKGTEKVESFIAMLEEDRRAVHKVLPLLPAKVFDALTCDSFIMDCHQKFASLDKDQTGALRPVDLFPLVVQVSSVHPFAVTEEQCKQFASIFDINGDGVIKMDEFLDFVRFLCVMSYLIQHGEGSMAEALEVMDDSTQVDHLIAMLKGDRANLKNVMPYLPDSLVQELLSEYFTMNCLGHFSKLDTNSNGSLDMQELFPYILQLTAARDLALDLEQCNEFAIIFDDNHNGSICYQEFVSMARYLVISGYLHSQEGQRICKTSVKDREPHVNPPINGSKLDQPVCNIDDAEAAKLVIDRDFYKNRVEKMSGENQSLRNRVLSLEQTIKKMESSLEETEKRLKHAEVDLLASRSKR